jgi:hypothetical protein
MPVCVFFRYLDNNSILKNKKINKMKSIKIFSAFFFMMSMSTAILAQDKTETFTVNGNCGMCKSSIEKAAKAAGATTAEWNKESKALTVTYNSTTTNTAKIQQKLLM